MLYFKRILCYVHPLHDFSFVLAYEIVLGVVAYDARNWMVALADKRCRIWKPVEIAFAVDLRIEVLLFYPLLKRHVEDERRAHLEIAFAEEQRAARAATRDGSGIDWYTFTVSFKGVFLEGLEVAFIVVTFGGAQHNVGLAAIGALVAAVVVLVAGLAVHRPLSQVPENTLKYAVGVMLTTFGIFWAAEGAGIHWPGSDASLIGLLAYVLATSALFVSLLRRRHARAQLIGATR